MNSGYVSRSMRVSNRNAPLKSATLVYPWTQFVPRRYPLTDHFPLGSTSAVGTNHNPVSPKNVVVAGRVSSAVAVDEDCVWVVVELCPVDVPEDPVCARALAATASASTHTPATRLAIVSRLQSRRHRSNVPFIPHGSLPRCPRQIGEPASRPVG